MLFVASSRMTVRKQREAVGLRDPPLEVTLAVLSEGTEVAGRGKKNPKNLERSAGNKPPRDKESSLRYSPVVFLSYVLCE